MALFGYIYRHLIELNPEEEKMSDFLYIGETAALTAAFLWGGSTLVFEHTGKKMGSFTTNLLRIMIGLILMCLVLYIQKGYIFPLQASKEQMFWLGLSGIVGLAIGDGALYVSLVIIGPRLATLLLSLAPPITVVLAWIFIDEKLGPLAIAGIILTVAGIIWVVNEKNVPEQFSGSKIKGVLFGILAAAGQATGVLLVKYGFQQELDALSATILRMLPATLFLLIIALLRGRLVRIFRAINNRRDALLIFFGSIIGPFLGVWLSIVAVKHTEAGVAATLLATVPITVIPLVIIIKKFKPSPRAILGAAIAVAGVALIFLRQ